MSLIYLDFDGVLHPESVMWHPRRGPFLWNADGHKLFENAELLERLLDPYPDVRIVLATRWTPRYGYSKTAGFLPDQLRARVIGATWHTRMSREAFESLSRGQQVVNDALRRGACDWLAIDDDDERWPPRYLDRLVLCRTYQGLAEPQVRAELASRLQALVR